MALRWGIISAGHISHDFVNALKTLPSGDHEIVAVATRTLENAKNFASKYDIPVAYEGYEKMAKDENVEVVYIGALNTQHHDIAKMMMEAGKHVLCEKPLTLNEKNTKHLVEIARSKRLFFMEAVWSRCFPVYSELDKYLKEGYIGNVTHVIVNFGFYLQETDRLKLKELGGGVTLDLGVYALQFQQFVYRDLRPIKILANGHLNEHGTDDSTSAILIYPNQKTAILSVSSLAEMPNEAIVVGTEGIIRIPEFWAPYKIYVNNKVKEFPLPKSNAQFNFRNSVGLSYEAEAVRKCIREGKIESSYITHDESILLAHYMDILRKEVGVIFPEDLK